MNKLILFLALILVPIFLRYEKNISSFLKRLKTVKLLKKYAIITILIFTGLIFSPVYEYIKSEKGMRFLINDPVRCIKKDTSQILKGIVFINPFIFSSASNTFVSEWDTTEAGSASDTVVIPMVAGGTINCNVDYGDGNDYDITTWNDSNWTHIYASSGTYTITITGDIGGLKFNNGGDKAKIGDISSWGNLILTDTSTFYGCTNLTCSATDIFQVSTTSMLWQFRDTAVVAVGDWASCDTSLVTDWNSCFRNAQDFDDPNFRYADTSAATILANMLYDCRSFNQEIDDLDTALCENFSSMFYGTWLFNKSLAGLDTSSGTNFTSFLYNAKAFNQSLNALDFGGATHMANLLRDALAYNQPIDWNTDICTTFSYMLKGTTALDQEILLVWEFVSNASYILWNSGLGDTNYSALLVHINNQTHLSSVTFYAAQASYLEGAVDSGTTDGTTTDELIDSSQNFLTTVTVNDIAHNTTDDEYANVDSVDSDTALSISADIMVSGENYTIQGSDAAKARYGLTINDSWSITDNGAA